MSFHDIVWGTLFHPSTLYKDDFFLSYGCVQSDGLNSRRRI